MSAGLGAGLVPRPLPEVAARAGRYAKAPGVQFRFTLLEADRSGLESVHKLDYPRGIP